jgi:serine/threonine protein kinase
MQLKPGDKLGPYEIVSPIGKGGMGEVWRARDPRLNRDVAIKVSAQQFTDRFEREARAIAALNHPNICTLYDVGPNYLVMELVDGPTLAERIAQGPVPLEEALTIAKQIAEALEAAHEKSIVHRDLKPANIKIKPAGSVKVLDFGLAKSGGQTELTSDSPTILTVAGMILGTAGYMAPEQAKGKVVDKRADIWAFGVVLYEMLAGKRLFEGDTVSETLAAVLKEQPDLNRVPAKVRPLLRRCLEKDPTKRLRDIGDAMLWVESAPEAAPTRTKWLWPSVAAALVVALAAVGWMFLRTPRLTDLPLVRQDVDLGSDIALPPPTRFVSNVVISPDGTRLAYVASAVSGGPRKLFTRRLDQPKATDLPGTEGAIRPFFSKDGHWLGFQVGRKLNKISVDGGAVVPLVELTGGFAGAAWGEDGIVVGQQGMGLVKIPEGGGQPVPVTQLAPGETFHTSPQILPGGKAVLFSSNLTTNPDMATIDVVSVAAHHRKTLVRGGVFPRFVASPNEVRGAGHLLYIFKGALYAILFDPDTLETRGTAAPVMNDVLGIADVGVPGNFDVSQTGTLVYQKGGGSGSVMTTLQWLNSSGKPEPLLARQGRYGYPRLSPDGKRAALEISDGTLVDIEVYEWQSDRTTKLTFGGGRNYYGPVWSPNGQFVVFGAGQGGMFWTRADGAGQPQMLTQTRTTQYPWSFSSDGKRLAFMTGGGNTQIWTMPIEEQGGQLKAGAPEPFLKDQFNDLLPSFSPDGRWLAYSSNESGPSEVYVRPFPPLASGQGGKWVISNQGGQHPVWSRTKNDLPYMAADGQIMAASYTVNGDTFVADKARVWLAKPGGTQFDLSSDGKRLAVLTPVASAEGPGRNTRWCSSRTSSTSCGGACH